MLTKGIEEVRKTPIARLMLTVLAEKEAAIHIYTKLGFKAELEPVQKDANAKTVITMFKDLSGPFSR